VIEAYDFKQRLWIFVELMDDALTMYVQTLHKTYSENIVKYVLKKSLEGLDFLHQKHIIHRDIKSDNLLMSARGDVKLADFGYACQLTEEKAGRQSKVGTVCWMAPELIKGERSYTTKVDIWSFGIFAMEMADGDPPYINEPQGRVIFNIVKKETPPIGPRWSNLYRDFVKVCLTKDAALRPDAAELLKHPFLADADDFQSEFQDSVTAYLQAKKTLPA
jgi:serine/threonine protein kinase